ncbi:MAG: hypothetical protein HOE25_04450, partial [Flavobacteriales bacterium]|nr:hypothetical protein [Flavobacteriales bacterium]
MNKILTILFAFLLLFPSFNTNAQTIQQPVTITDSILCYGDLAEINIIINQTIPSTAAKVIIGYYIGPTFLSITSTNNTTLTSINVPGLAAQTYTVRLVDSVSYYATTPNGANPSSIYDSTSINITEPPPITVSGSVINATNVLTFDGNIDISVAGGTSPYTFSWTGPGGPYGTEDLSGLQSGTYNVS